MPHIAPGAVKFALVSLFSLTMVHFSSFAAGRLPAEIYRLPKEAIEALQSGTEFILYSLDPGPLSLEPPVIRPEENFDGFKMIGRLPLVDAKSRSIAIRSVSDSIQSADYHFIKACFFPRHALRVTASGQVFDFIICYQCGQIRLYQKGAEVARIGIPSKPEPLNELLSAAGLPLAKPTIETRPETK